MRLRPHCLHHSSVLFSTVLHGTAQYSSVLKHRSVLRLMGGQLQSFSSEMESSWSWSAPDVRCVALVVVCPRHVWPFLSRVLPSSSLCDAPFPCCSVPSNVWWEPMGPSSARGERPPLTSHKSPVTRPQVIESQVTRHAGGAARHSRVRAVWPQRGLLSCAAQQ